MRKKSGFTIVEQAIVLVPEFEKVVQKLEQQVALRGQSISTLQTSALVHLPDSECRCPPSFLDVLFLWQPI